MSIMWPRERLHINPLAVVYGAGTGVFNLLISSRAEHAGKPLARGREEYPFRKGRDGEE